MGPCHPPKTDRSSVRRKAAPGVRSRSLPTTTYRTGQAGAPLTPEARAVLEDRLALAGLDVSGDIPRPMGDVLEEDC